MTIKILLFIILGLIVIGLLSIVSLVTKFVSKLHNSLNSINMYMSPIRLKEKAQKDNKEDDEKHFQEFIDCQNRDIYKAMRENKKKTCYKFHGYYQKYCSDEYRDEFTKRADKYYKKYKIDGDKISWE